MNDGITIMLYGLLALAIALTGYSIGKTKGHPGLGLLLAMFLGPIGWVIMLMQSDARFQCPACGGNCVPGKPRCCNCGAEIAAQKKPAMGRAGAMPDPAWNDPLAIAERERRKAVLRPVAARRTITVKRVAQ